VSRQRYEAAFPIEQLTEHPDNPRRGDEGVLERSMDAHGFYGAVIAQASSRRIIAGNHRTRVARRRGETTVPVILLDVDDDQARRILLIDNRSSDVATYDDQALLSLLVELEGTAGTGFDATDIDRLLLELQPDPDQPDPADERYTPRWIFDGMGLTFDVDVSAPVDPARRTVPARRYLTVRDDGLAQPWAGLVWMNPPYSRAIEWAHRWTAHAQGVALISVSGSPWVAELCETADVFAFASNLDFVTPDGSRTEIPWPTFMAAAGPGTVGLLRLAARQNWPVFSRCRRRPRPADPMIFRET
jgi:DNA N-6-adenine-methyltransferase (Dam)/ParB/Sulfiredoxin domain